jgi:hypothetical protein
MRDISDVTVWKAWRAERDEQGERMPEPVRTYDENGVTVKVYKTMIAEGYEGNGVECR